MAVQLKKSPKLIYLDYAAATPTDIQVVAAMKPFWTENFGNPSSLYSKGRETKKALEAARKKISTILSAKPEEITFTAGGTESVNMAILGVVHGTAAPPHIITTTIEHHAVLRVCEMLEKEGAQVTYVPVNEFGFVSEKDIFSAIQKNTVLISVMYANNEVGTIEPIQKIAQGLKKINSERATKKLPHILFHTDACQAPAFLDMNVQKLHIDLLSLNASKIYGPKQIGLLYIRHGIKLHPFVFGGGQEHTLRSGTENIPGIVGFAEALQLANKNRIKEGKRLRELRNYFVKRIVEKIPMAEINGPSIESGREVAPTRLPNNINISFPGIDGEALMLYLDASNVCVSTGSACAETSNDPSHVLLALGKTKEQAKSAIRITLGNSTTNKQLDYVLNILPNLIQKLHKTNNLI